MAPDVSEIRIEDIVDRVNDLLRQGWILLETCVDRQVRREDDVVFVLEVPQYVLGKPRKSP
jgi:hypothetical protein